MPFVPMPGSAQEHIKRDADGCGESKVPWPRGVTACKLVPCRLIPCKPLPCRPLPCKPLPCDLIFTVKLADHSLHVNLQTVSVCTRKDFVY